MVRLVHLLRGVLGAELLMASVTQLSSAMVSSWRSWVGEADARDGPTDPNAGRVQQLEENGALAQDLRQTGRANQFLKLNPNLAESGLDRSQISAGSTGLHRVLPPAP